SSSAIYSRSVRQLCDPVCAANARFGWHRWSRYRGRMVVLQTQEYAERGGLGRGKRSNRLRCRWRSDRRGQRRHSDLWIRQCGEHRYNQGYQTAEDGQLYLEFAGHRSYRESAATAAPLIVIRLGPGVDYSARRRVAQLRYRLRTRTQFIREPGDKRER